MKKIRNVLLLVLAFVLFGGLTSVRADEKVKVYIFEAGGCPYCEAEIEYLEGLSSYGEKFEIVREELYVDHVDWEKGKDYELGKAVAEAFLSAGFESASYQGTPFVVISNIYAAASYSTDLEAYIDKAYEEGDKDVVSCYANGGENCLEGADPSIQVDTSKTTDTKDDKKDVETITTVVLLLFIAGSIALVIYSGKRNSEIKEEKIVYEETVKETKPEIKKTPSNKKPGVKKTSYKKKN